MFLTFACCFGQNVGRKASNDLNHEQQLKVRGSGGNLHSVAKGKGRLADARIDAPWELHLGQQLPSFIVESNIPAAVLALEHPGFAKVPYVSALGSSLQCIFINDSIEQLLGPSTAQAYERLILSTLLETEPSFLVEVRETLLSLLEPECHTPLLAVAASSTYAKQGWMACGAPPAGEQIAAAASPKQLRKVQRSIAAPSTRWLSDKYNGDDYHNDIDIKSGGSVNAQSLDYGLEGLRLHPCWVYDEVAFPSEDGCGAAVSTNGRRCRPGVIVWHRQALKGQLCRALALRSLGLLSHLDAAVTLIAPSGSVVFQNAASSRYHGCLTGRRGTSAIAAAAAAALPKAPVLLAAATTGLTSNVVTTSRGSDNGSSLRGCTPLRRAATRLEACGSWAGDRTSLLLGLRSSHVLLRIFSCDLNCMADDMLTAWESGRTWKRLLHVPPPVRAPNDILDLHRLYQHKTLQTDNAQVKGAASAAPGRTLTPLTDHSALDGGDAALEEGNGGDGNGLSGPASYVPLASACSTRMGLVSPQPPQLQPLLPTQAGNPALLSRVHQQRSLTSPSRSPISPTSAVAAATEASSNCSSPQRPYRSVVRADVGSFRGLRQTLVSVGISPPRPTSPSATSDSLNTAPASLPSAFPAPTPQHSGTQQRHRHASPLLLHSQMLLRQISVQPHSRMASGLPSGVGNISGSGMQSVGNTNAVLASGASSTYTAHSSMVLEDGFHQEGPHSQAPPPPPPPRVSVSSSSLGRKLKLVLGLGLGLVGRGDRNGSSLGLASLAAEAEGQPSPTAAAQAPFATVAKPPPHPGIAPRNVVRYLLTSATEPVDMVERSYSALVSTMQPLRQGAVASQGRRTNLSSLGNSMGFTRMSSAVATATVDTAFSAYNPAMSVASSFGAGSGRLESTLGGGCFQMAGVDARQLATETRGSAIEDDPLQMSAWRAALKVSTSRRSLECRAPRPLAPLTAAGAASAVAPVTAMSGRASGSIHGLLSSTRDWNASSVGCPDADSVTAAATLISSRVATAAPVAIRAASIDDPMLRLDVQARQGRTVSAFIARPMSGVASAAADGWPRDRYGTASGLLQNASTRGLEMRSAAGSGGGISFGNGGRCGGSNYGGNAAGHVSRGTKRSSLELAITLAASAGGKSFSMGGMRAAPPSLMSGDDRTHVFVVQRNDSADSGSGITSFVMPSADSFAQGSCSMSGTDGKLPGPQRLAALKATTGAAVERDSARASGVVMKKSAPAVEVEAEATTLVIAESCTGCWDTADSTSDNPTAASLIQELRLAMLSPRTTIPMEAAPQVAAAAASKPSPGAAIASTPGVHPFSQKVVFPMSRQSFSPDTCDSRDAVHDDPILCNMATGDRAAAGPGDEPTYGRCAHASHELITTGEHTEKVTESLGSCLGAFDPWVLRLLDVGGVPSDAQELLLKAITSPPSPLLSPPQPLPLPQQQQQHEASGTVANKSLPLETAIATSALEDRETYSTASTAMTAAGAMVTSAPHSPEASSLILAREESLSASPFTTLASHSAACRLGSHRPSCRTLTGVQEAEEGPASAVGVDPLFRPSTSNICMARQQAPLPPQWLAALSDSCLPVTSSAPLPLTSSTRLPPNGCFARSAYERKAEDKLCWHEVTASPFFDPVTRQRMLLVVQADVTSRVEAERRLVELTAAQTGMLEQMFPRHVLEFVAQQGEAISGMDFSANVESFATSHELATVLFTDIIGFTTMSKALPAAAVMVFLSELYSRLDALVDKYGVWKVETAGDCYIVAAGVVRQDADGFQSVVVVPELQSSSHFPAPMHLSPSFTSMRGALSRSVSPPNVRPAPQSLNTSCCPLQHNNNLRNHHSRRDLNRIRGQSPSQQHEAAAQEREGNCELPQSRASAASHHGQSRCGPCTHPQSHQHNLQQQQQQRKDDSPAPLLEGRCCGDPSQKNTVRQQQQRLAQGGSGVAGDLIAAENREREAEARRDADSVFRFALAMLDAARGVRMPHNGEPVQLRVGIHSGPLVSGVIGTKMPKFALFGDTMNTASRMESTCNPGCIQVSARTRALLPHVALQPTGGVMVKGKGVMETYVFEPHYGEAATDNPTSTSPTTATSVPVTRTAAISASAASTTTANGPEGMPLGAGLQLASTSLPATMDVAAGSTAPPCQVVHEDKDRSEGDPPHITTVRISGFAVESTAASPPDPTAASPLPPRPSNLRSLRQLTAAVPHSVSSVSPEGDLKSVKPKKLPAAEALGGARGCPPRVDNTAASGGLPSSPQQQQQRQKLRRTSSAAAAVSAMDLSFSHLAM